LNRPLLICAALALSLCGLAGWAAENAATMTLSSSDIQPGQMIPAKYTCEGADTSPALSWSGAPAGTKCFALLCEDPDAPVGLWVHWVIYDLPAAEPFLKEGLPREKTLPGGAKQGLNSWPKIGYGGPCPPPGPAHRYYFRIYALDAPTGLAAGATRAELLKAMDGHILASGELMGLYQR
jgi:Raf kinase inhibitor-like YbhB/YbcL family protein